MKVCIYLRKSTDREDKQQLSLESQRAECETLCKREGFEIVHIYEEAISAKIEETRPKFQDMIDRCKKWDFEAIVAWKLDRLSRNPIDGAKLQTLIQRKHITKIHTVSDGVFGMNESTMMMAVILSFANHYVMKLSEDTKRGMLAKFRKGQFVWPPPRGYKKNEDDIWIIDELQAWEVRMVFDLRKKWWTTTDIAEHMNDRGIMKTRSGGELSRKAIEGILRNRAYTGLLEFAGEMVMNKSLAIIDRAIFDYANSKMGIKPKRKEKFVLKGMVKDQDGNLLTASESTGNTTKVVYYHGYWPGAIRIREDKLISAMDEMMNTIEIRPEIVEITKKALLKHLKKANGILQDNQLHLHAKKSQLSKKIDSYIDMRANDEITQEQFKAKNQELLIELQKIDEALSAMQIANIDIVQEVWEIVELFSNLVQHWNKAKKSQKLELMGILLLELFVDTKKAVVLRKNEFFEVATASFGFEWLPEASRDRTFKSMLQMLEWARKQKALIQDMLLFIQ